MKPKHITVSNLKTVRTFNNKRYQLFTETLSTNKGHMERWAKKYREKGYAVRIVPVAKDKVIGYAAYIRKESMNI